MTVSARHPTSPWLILARHAVGMLALALGYVEIYSSQMPVLAWLLAGLVPWIFAAPFILLYLLFFTRHAKPRWRTAWAGLAWLILLMMVAEPWLSELNQRERDREILLQHRESQTRMEQKQAPGPAIDLLEMAKPPAAGTQ